MFDRNLDKRQAMSAQNSPHNKKTTSQIRNKPQEERKARHVPINFHKTKELEHSDDDSINMSDDLIDEVNKKPTRRNA